METFVKNDLEEIIESKAAENIQELEFIKPLFFGLYASNPKKFSVIAGDRKMIKAIASFVKSKLEVDNQFFQEKNAAKKKTVLGRKGLVDSVIGAIFADAANQITAGTSKLDPQVSDGWKQKLFEKAKALVDSFRASNPELNVKPFTINMIEVDLSKLDNIKASVQCVFCETQRLSVHCRLASSSSSSCTWVLANLNSHFKRCLKPKRIPLETEDALDQYHLADNNLDSGGSHLVGLNIEVDLETVKTENDLGSKLFSLEKTIKTQMTVQNILLDNAKVENDEEHIFVQIKSPQETIETFRIEGDGNCLFSAISHQIHFVKIHSEKHKEFTENLRKDVVEYIRNNLDFFQHDIKGRIHEKKKEIPDLKKESYAFLDKLSDDGFFGGIESLRATAILHNVNIIVFSEKGECYLANKFEPEFRRSIMLVFRLKTMKTAASEQKTMKTAASERNHYDSVAKLQDKTIENCAKYLIKSQVSLVDLENIATISDSSAEE